MLTVKEFLAHCLMRAFSVFPLQDKVVFSSFSGKNCDDNPKVIFDVFIEKGMPIKYIWLLEDTTHPVEGAITVRNSSWRSIYHLATAKLWVDCSRKSRWVRKRNKQYYVQTWHGDLALKKIERDAIDNLPVKYIESAIHDSQMADLFLSGSKWGTNNYRSAFWYDGEILEYGLPKSDILHQNPTAFRASVRQTLKLDENQKIVLYVPTFRKDRRIDCYNLNDTLLVEALNRYWGGAWSFLYKMHPNINDLSEMQLFSNEAIDVSHFESVNELILASDLIITDYSACMFQGLEAEKRVILYASDIQQYMHEDRGFYFSFSDLPFSMNTNNDELISCIKQFSDEDYLLKVSSFKKEVGLFHLEHSAEKVTDYIIEKVWGMHNESR